MANVRARLARATTVLLTDDEVFNKDVTGVRSLEDIKAVMHIRGRLRKVGDFGDALVYQMGGQHGYNFTLRIID